MHPVKPDKITTLMLDPTYMPFALATARASFRHVVTGKAFGIDADGARFDYRENISHNIRPHPNQPVLRSVNTTWIVPTVIVVTKRFFMPKKKLKLDKDGLPSLKIVYDFYKGVCQCCLQRVRFSEASRDHTLPKSKNGSNDLSNIVLMHKDCNRSFGSQYPKYNVNGEPIQAKFKVSPSHFTVPEGIEYREEWKNFLFQHDIIQDHGVLS